MGVPALFRWLSKKYPKIVASVVEEEEATLPGEDDQDILVPVNISGPNPNGMEFDNLYLDMNGIVHPCTHPEGKPAPETEEEMMVEVFKYTERVVNMIRPRKLLFMAIDGVAPRAKMNQQRSRRFRSAQEAREKYEARLEAEAEWRAMGKEITSEAKQAWDSNAITPGTPFMDLLATSLQYWVVQKLNTDPGWKNMQVYISDASVPGEGEHKIMDFIRRQRANHGHDPNTKHVIYGLDADLIMLALATHEPHFKVLREDVFSQDTSPGACRICGQEGHYAAQCTGSKAEVKKEPPKKKPFIFLDVSVLREYLEVELSVPQIPFPFNLEQAIDDWVLLIFFVGNDFLPHLPSLEIREGAIDTLLKIWKDELPRMGGYLTNHGQLELSRAEIILSGLARREDDIFKRRREAEERQDQNAKRRKLDIQGNNNQSQGNGPSPSLNLTADPTPPAPPLPLHASLPPRPDFAARADSIGLGGPKTVDAAQNATAATLALGGSNRDIVANRRAIRMANMSAAEVLKAELGQSGSSPTPSPTVADSPVVRDPILPVTSEAEEDEIPGLGGDSFMEETETLNGTAEIKLSAAAENFLSGVKRKLEEVDDSDGTPIIPDEDEEPGKGPLALKVHPDGTVEQEDSVKLWEPGYRERYYEQKFGFPYADSESRKKITTCYVEGIAWVLHYYYQGPPSWQWYYPYHFAPFASDFVDVEHMDIKFTLGQPFKPFEQLMSVFPAASRHLIPPVFHDLMTNSESPIIDFYPTSFEIDMNGKKMSWQGVALLPFIDERRLLEAMHPRYPKLTDIEMRRNQRGEDVLFVSDDHPLYPSLEALYGKKRSQQSIPVDYHPSKGINGSLLPNPECIPGSTFCSPLTSQGLQDIPNDRSLSAFYYSPEQLTPHRSILLAGVARAPRVLTPEDLEVTRRGGRGRGGGDRGGRGGRGQRNMYMYEGNGREPRYNQDSRNGSHSGGRDYGGRGYNQPSNYPYPSPTQTHGNSYGRYPPQGNNPYNQQGGYRGAPPSSYDSRPPYQQPSYGGGRGGYNSGYDGSYGGGANGYAGRGGGPPSHRGGGVPYGGGGYGGQGGQGGGYGYGNQSGGYNQPPPYGGGRGRGDYSGGGGYHSGGGYQSSGPYSTGFESYGNRGGYNQRGRGRGRGH